MTLTLPDLLTVAGIAGSVLVPSVFYVKRKMDTLTGNHLSHIDSKIDDVGEKVDRLSEDVHTFMGKFDGYELPERVRRLERREFNMWEDR